MRKAHRDGEVILDLQFSVAVSRGGFEFADITPRDASLYLPQQLGVASQLPAL